MTLYKYRKPAYIPAAIVCLLPVSAMTSAALGQAPAPTACVPVGERAGRDVGCWILAREPLGPLTQPEVFWHLETYPNRNAAEAAKGLHGTVVEALGKIWLLTIGKTGWRPTGGTHIAEVGPIPVKTGESYTAHYMEGISNPGDVIPKHRHPGPEAWYTMAGSFCAETPQGKKESHAGQGIVIPADNTGWSRMTLTVTGTEIRRSLVLVLHESAHPWTAPASDWTPQGLCQAKELPDSSGPTATAAMARERNTQIIADKVYLKPQRLVTVEGHRKLNIYCTGRGSPTVIFDSGLGEGMMFWALVQPRVAAETRVCSYDRAGLGFSDPGTEPRTSANIVDDLHRLLQAAHIRPPYVLVGHSFGGMNIKLYAYTYGSEVAGMVFVDPSHEDLAKRAWELDPERAKAGARYNEFLQGCLEAKPEEFVPGSRLREGCGTPPSAERFSVAINALQLERAIRPGYRGAWISEQLNVWTRSAEQLRTAHRSLGDMPIVVLTHEPLPRRGNETQEMADGQNRIRTELHTEISRMSTRGTIRTVHNSEHHFQLDQPQEVTDAVLEVVRAASVNEAARLGR